MRPEGPSRKRRKPRLGRRLDRCWAWPNLVLLIKFYFYKMFGSILLSAVFIILNVTIVSFLSPFINSYLTYYSINAIIRDRLQIKYAPAASLNLKLIGRKSTVGRKRIWPPRRQPAYSFQLSKLARIGRFSKTRSSKAGPLQNASKWGYTHEHQRHLAVAQLTLQPRWTQTFGDNNKNIKIWSYLFNFSHI